MLYLILCIGSCKELSILSWIFPDAFGRDRGKDERKKRTYHRSLPLKSFSHVTETVSTVLIEVHVNSKKEDWMKNFTEGLDETLIHINCIRGELLHKLCHSASEEFIFQECIPTYSLECTFKCFTQG